jgi:hypothetical protein
VLYVSCSQLGADRPSLRGQQRMSQHSEGLAQAAGGRQHRGREAWVQHPPHNATRGMQRTPVQRVPVQLTTLPVASSLHPSHRTRLLVCTRVLTYTGRVLHRRRCGETNPLAWQLGVNQRSALQGSGVLAARAGYVSTSCTDTRRPATAGRRRCTSPPRAGGPTRWWS